MTRPAHYYDPYDRLAPYYDWMAKVMLVPFGGERSFRRRIIAELDLAPGTSVLELGCGTGSMTRHLSYFGADVTAVDLSEPMLSRARRKNPSVHFVQADMLEFDAGRSFDRVLLSWVLHEMDEATRTRVLSSARRHLAPGGLLGVFDFAGEASPLVDRMFRSYLRLAEPELTIEFLRDGFEPLLRAAGFTPIRSATFALGTTKMVVAERASAVRDL